MAEGQRQYTEDDKVAALANGQYCPRSRRVDGPTHSWEFDGDDPYVVCCWCHERRDALTGRVIK